DLGRHRLRPDRTGPAPDRTPGPDRVLGRLRLGRTRHGDLRNPRRGRYLDRGTRLHTLGVAQRPRPSSDHPRRRGLPPQHTLSTGTSAWLVGAAHDRRTTSTVVAGPGRTGHCHGRRTTRPGRGRDGHRTTLRWVRTHPTAVVACRP